MKILKRIFGICETKSPENQNSWRYSGGSLEIDLSKVGELSEGGAAVRLEGKGLPKRVIVVHEGEGKYHAFENKCAHFGRRLDPLPGQPLIQCCSIGKSTFEYSGARVSGFAKKSIAAYPVERRGDTLSIKIFRCLTAADRASAPPVRQKSSKG